MKKTFTALAALTAFAAAPASAAEFAFEFEGDALIGSGPITGSGIFTVSDTPITVNGEEAFQITGISGLLNGSAITGLVPGIFGANNVFYKTEFFVRGQGIGFENEAGQTANLFLQQGSRYRVNTINPFTTGFVDASVQQVNVNGAVPEPATWMMMLIGFMAVGAGMRYRRKTMSVSYG